MAATLIRLNYQRVDTQKEYLTTLDMFIRRANKMKCYDYGDEVQVHLFVHDYFVEIVLYKLEGGFYTPGYIASQARETLAAWPNVRDLWKADELAISLWKQIDNNKTTTHVDLILEIGEK